MSQNLQRVYDEYSSSLKILSSCLIIEGIMKAGNRDMYWMSQTSSLHQR